MSALPPKSPATAAPFSDAFGYRVLGFDKKSGDRLEMLRLRPQLASSAPFEAALRERQRRLSDFRHPAFARVRQIDRPAGQSAALAIVSNHFEGLRLSDLLKLVEGHGVRLDVVSALCMLRQAVAAIGRLHECGEDISHGAINPERLVVSGTGRVIVTEYVLGAGLDALALSRQQAWQDYRVVLPGAAAPARLDHAADIFQLGYIGLTLVSGRSLFERQYPVAFADRLAAAQAIETEGPAQPLHPSVRAWLSRALWLDTVPFSTVVEAQAVLEDALEASGFVAGPDVVVDLVERCFAVAPDQRPRAGASPTESTIIGQPAPAAEFRAPEPRVEPAPVRNTNDVPTQILPPEVETTSQTALASTPEPEPMASVASLLVDAQTAAASVDETPAPALNLPTETVAPEPEAELPLAAEAPADAAPELPAARAWSPQAKVERPKPEPVVRQEAARVGALRPEPAMFSRHGDAAETAAEPAAAEQKVRRPYVIALTMAVVMVAIFEVAIRYVNPFAAAPAKAIAASELPTTNGTLSIDASPKAKVFIDEAPRGETPLRVDLPAGQHNLRLEGEGGAHRTLVVNVVGGKEMSQLVELGRATVTTGTLEVSSEPTGARVLLDGKSVGVSPVVVPDLKPGAHAIVVEGPNGSIRQVVQVAAGATASVLVPLNAATSNLPTGGWLTVEAAEEMQVYNGGRLLGTSRTERIMLPGGKHELELRNDAVGFSVNRTVQVQPGKVAKVSVQLPDGSLSLNATPWAEVFVDGQRVGETPVGNVAVRAGTHEVVFRHPEHGEIRQTVVVKAGEAGRVTVNMAK